MEPQEVPADLLEVAATLLPGADLRHATLARGQFHDVVLLPGEAALRVARRPAAAALLSRRTALLGRLQEIGLPFEVPRPLGSVTTLGDTQPLPRPGSVEVPSPRWRCRRPSSPRCCKCCAPSRLTRLPTFSTFPTTTPGVTTGGVSYWTRPCPFCRLIGAHGPAPASTPHTASCPWCGLWEQGHGDIWASHAASTGWPS